MSDLLQLAAKQHAILVTFTWPAPLPDDFGDLVLEDDISIARYTNWVGESAELQVDNEQFETVPQLGVQLGEQTGKLQDGDHELEIPSSLPPADTLGTIGPHVKVEVKIEEVLPGDNTTRRMLAFGWVGRARRGMLGRSGITVLTINPLSHLLRNAVLGLQITERCPWRFGDDNCKLAIVRPGQSPNTAIFAQQEQGTISVISGNTITVTGLTTTATLEYWLFGWVQVAGLRLRIHNYTTGNVFGLSQRPPASWAGATIVMTPGCDKTPSVCHNRWDNILNMGAIGVFMPRRYVLLEKPAPSTA